MMIQLWFSGSLLACNAEVQVWFQDNAAFLLGRNKMDGPRFKPGPIAWKTSILLLYSVAV